jgi:heat shock protein HtpX
MQTGFTSSVNDEEPDILDPGPMMMFFIRFFIIFAFFAYLGWEQYYQYLFHRPPLPQFQLEGIFPFGTIFAGVVGITCAATSFKWGKNSILWALHAIPINESDQDCTELHNIVDEMRLAAGIPCPEVHILDDSDPNAFAMGSNPENACIVVTRGLLNTLNREELQGVIAHEMSHIRNYDIRLRTAYLALFGSVVLLSDWSRKGLLLGRYGLYNVVRIKGSFKIVFIITWLITALFAPLIAWLLAMAISRNREYLADASAVELTRNPEGLVRALEKIEKASAPTISCKRGVAAFCIVDPLGKRLNKKEGFFADLFATHPPLKKRVMILRALAYQGQSSK